jgi:hypothetical protein
MTRFPLPALKSPALRLLLAAACCLPFGDACSSSDSNAAVLVPVGVTVTTINDLAPAESIALGCDDLSLAVVVSITPADTFLLRPPRYCGTALQCGYLRLEALASDGTTLASVDTATDIGVIQLSAEQVASVTQLRASLLRGVDDAVVKDADGHNTVAISLQAPADCDVAARGGAGGQGAAGADALAGAGGALGLGGAPGQAGAAGLAGAGGSAAAAAGAEAAFAGGAPEAVAGQPAGTDI